MGDEQSTRKSGRFRMVTHDFFDCGLAVQRRPLPLETPNTCAVVAAHGRSIAIGPNCSLGDGRVSRSRDGGPGGSTALPRLPPWGVIYPPALGHGLVRRGRALGHGLVRRGRAPGHGLVRCGRGHALGRGLVLRHGLVRRGRDPVDTRKYSDYNPPSPVSFSRTPLSR